MSTQTKHTIDIKLKCKCGALQGLAKDISNSTGRRAVCMCDDCQAYAHYLGIASEVLDANGGTDIFPVAPAKLKITHGLENLKCLRLTKKGLYRWYAGCCKTPIANSMASPKVPFAGVVHNFMDHATDGITRDQALGLVQSKFQAKFGIGPLPQDAHKSVPLGIILTTIKFLALGFIKQEHRPSPFFDDNGQPRVAPYVLTREEREGVRKLCGPK
jgi:hypothetical protein